MVELRWLQRPWPNPNELPPYTDPAYNEPALQYRQQKFISGMEFLGGTWTEWQDVPIVHSQPLPAANTQETSNV